MSSAQYVTIQMTNFLKNVCMSRTIEKREKEQKLWIL